MAETSGKKSRHKKNLSEWILNYDKNAYCDSKIRDEDREILIESYNECSDLRKSFHESLNNLVNNLGFPSMKNIHRRLKSSSNFFGNKEFNLMKNNSSSKLYLKKYNIIDGKQKQKHKKKIITSIRTKLLPKDILYNDDEGDSNDIYVNKKEINEINKKELEFINEMIYDIEEKKKIFSKEVIESENEDSEEKNKLENNKKKRKNSNESINDNRKYNIKRKEKELSNEQHSLDKESKNMKNCNEKEHNYPLYNKIYLKDDIDRQNEKDLTENLTNKYNYLS